MLVIVMNEPYDYREELLNLLKDYNRVVLSDDGKSCSIEIKNDDDRSLIIDLDNEVTISFDKWHNHYYIEDRDDYDEAIDKVLNILNNIDCIINIYSNNKYVCSGSSLDKSKYTEEDVLNYMKSFFGDYLSSSFNESFKNYGATIEFIFWNKDNNYELEISKEDF